MLETFRFTSTKYKNPILSAATNQLHIMLTNQMQSTVAAEPRSQRLKTMMLLDQPCLTKSKGIEDTKIRYTLLQQMEKNNCNFSYCQELLSLILDIRKEDTQSLSETIRVKQW